MFVGKAMSLPKSGKATLALLANIRLGWKGFHGANTPSLQTFVNYGCKKFCNIVPEVVTFQIEF
jgi:hypothetical protein